MSLANMGIKEMIISLSNSSLVNIIQWVRLVVGSSDRYFCERIKQAATTVSN